MIYLFCFELCALIFVVELTFSFSKVSSSALTCCSAAAAACLFCAIACCYNFLFSVVFVFFVLRILSPRVVFSLFFILSSEMKTNLFISLAISYEHGCLILQFMCSKMCDKTVCCTVVRFSAFVRLFQHGLWICIFRIDEHSHSHS